MYSLMMSSLRSSHCVAEMLVAIGMDQLAADFGEGVREPVQLISKLMPTNVLKSIMDI